MRERGAVAGCRFESSLGAALVAILLAALSHPAFAGPNDWMSFGRQPDTASIDRNFIRQWESNPPPGYPTLSPANVAATAAAIKRYEAIVEAGGWQEIPNIELSTG